MAHIREETVHSFDESTLLRMVKTSLDELGIAYENKSGGFGNNFFLSATPDAPCLFGQ